MAEKVDQVVVPTVRPQRREQPDRKVIPWRWAAPWRWAGGEAWLRSALAVAAGLVLYAASPPRDVWWLVPLAFALFAGVVHGRRARAGFGLGLLFGLASLLPLLGWLLDFLGAQFGPWPWLGVAAVEALFFGVGGAGMALVSRLRAAPVWMAAVFVAAESVRSSAPFGGFPWGRLAFTQGSGALLPLASIGGAVLVSFVVALIGAALAVFALRLREAPRRLASPLVMALVPVVAGLGVMPLLGVDANAGTARVGVIQGNAPNLGLDLLYEDDVLRDNHVRAAEKYADDVQAGRVARPDVVVLPEQVGSWGPTRTDPDYSRIAARLGVPLVIGGLAQDGGSRLSNVVVRWDPVAGASGEYVKRHLVPFAETIPMRPVARLVSPFVDRFRQDMVAGDRPGVLDVGPVRLGLGICYDVAYDDVFAGAVRSGATLLAVPTNNAWYGYSEMSYQQLAMSQLRAVEHGRAVVVSATSGVSAVVQPDGEVTQRSEQFTARNMTAELPLRSTQTVATRLGAVPAWTLGLLGAGAVAFAWWRRRQEPRGEQ